MRRALPVIVTACVFLFCLGIRLSALPSLMAEDIVSDFPVQAAGKAERCSVIRDANDRSLFYYVPNRPRLAERDGEPIFHLLKYSRKKAAGSSKLVQGAILQFAVTLALPLEIQEALKTEIARRFRLEAGKVVLTCLPMKSASMAFYTPKGEFLGESVQSPGIAPTFASQEIPVLVQLTELGADVYNELLQGRTGIPALSDFTFEGLTPSCGIKVTINWLQCQAHLSAAAEIKGSGAYKMIGASLTGGMETAFEAMVQKKAVTVETLAGEALPPDQMQKYMGMVMDMIMAELAEVNPPPKVDPTKLGDTPVSAPEGMGLTVGGGFKIKSATTVRKGTTTFDLTSRLLAERRTSCGGFIGIGGYPEKIRETLITVLPEGDWPNAHFSLPVVGNAAAVGVSSVDLTIGIVDPDGKTPAKGAPQSESVKWTAASPQWRRDDAVVSSIVFPLMGLKKVQGSNLYKLKFRVTARITYTLDNRTILVEVAQLEPLFNGDLPVADPLALVDIVTIANSFTFGPEARLAFAVVKLTAASPTKKVTLTGKIQDNDPLSFIIERGAQVTATVTVQPRKGKAYPLPPLDLMESGLSASLGDWDLAD